MATTFDAVFRELVAGNITCADRPHWKTRHTVLVIENNNILIKFTNTGLSTHYYPTIDDMLSTEWVGYNHPADFNLREHPGEQTP